MENLYDRSITTMFKNQSRMSYCWILYSNNQSNERTSTEARSDAVTSTSSSSRTTTYTLITANPTVLSRKETTLTTSNNEPIQADEDELASVHLMLEPHLRPAPHDPKSELSKKIFEEHKQLAKEYLKMQTEIAYNLKHREELLAKLDPKERQDRLDFSNKLMEKEELLKFRSNLERQLQLIRMNTRPPPNHIPNTTEPNVPQTQITRPTYNRQDSNSSIVAGDDGWVLVPSQHESDA